MIDSDTKTPLDADPLQLASEPRLLAARLSVLIFLAYAIMGAWVPVFTLHLKALGFSPEAAAWASATSAIGSLFAPLFWGQVADRWLAMQRCISLCALATGVGLLTLAELREPWAVNLLCLAMWYFLIPTIGLSISFVFRQLEHPERRYGKIRMWGTVGWVAASWCLTAWFNISGRFVSADAPVDLADSLRLGGLLALVLTLYAPTLPHTPPREMAAPSRAWYAQLVDAPMSALHLFRDRSFAVYATCMFGQNVTLAFSIQLTPLFFARLGVPSEQLPLCLTIAQSTEVLFLYLLPFLLMRFGTKQIMVAGGVAWTLGLTVLGVGLPVWVALVSLAANGVFICCFFIAGQVFANRQATHDIRASTQGLLLLVSGSGLLLGHLLVGWIRAWTADDYGMAFRMASGVSAALTALFIAGFLAAAPPQSGQEALAEDREIP